MGSCNSSHSHKPNSSPSSRPTTKPKKLHKRRSSPQHHLKSSSNQIASITNTVRTEPSNELLVITNSSAAGLMENTVSTEAVRNDNAKKRSRLPMFGARKIVPQAGSSISTPSSSDMNAKTSVKPVKPKMIGIQKLSDQTTTSSSSSVSSELSQSSFSTKSSASSTNTTKTITNFTKIPGVGGYRAQRNVDSSKPSGLPVTAKYFDSDHSCRKTLPSRTSESISQNSEPPTKSRTYIGILPKPTLRNSAATENKPNAERLDSTKVSVANCIQQHSTTTSKVSQAVPSLTGARFHPPLRVPAQNARIPQHRMDIARAEFFSPLRSTAFGSDKQSCPYKRPGAAAIILTHNPSRASIESAPRSCYSIVNTSQSQLSNQSDTLKKTNWIDSQPSSSSFVERDISSPDPRIRYNADVRTRQPIPAPIKLTDLRKPGITSRSILPKLHEPLEDSSKQTDCLPSSYEQLKTCMTRANISHESPSFSSGNSTPIVLSPDRKFPNRQSSAGSHSGTDGDKDFLIDDEICDQPGLFLNADKLNGQVKMLEKSLSELQNLTAKQSVDTSVKPEVTTTPVANSHTPKTTRFRKPRALSLIESPDGYMGFDNPSYRTLVQDMNGVKTLLFRLQGLLQNVRLDL